MNKTSAIALKGASIAGVLLSMGISAFAVPITGGFGTTSAGVMTYSNGGSVHKIDYCPPDATSPSIGTATCNLGGPTPGLGILSVQGGTTGSTFGSIVAPVAGTIRDMVDQPGNAPFTYFPVGIPNQNIDNFITVSTFPTFNFQADEFVNQTCAPSATTLCVGGFILTQVGLNVSVSFTVNGTVFAPGFDATNFTDVITGQFNNITKEAVAAAANTTGGIFSNTWSGSVTMAPIPEPGTMTMLGIGLIAIVLGGRRAKQRAGSEN